MEYFGKHRLISLTFQGPFVKFLYKVIWNPAVFIFFLHGTNSVRGSVIESNIDRTRSTKELPSKYTPVHEGNCCFIYFW